jgi:Undecaprenyl-phosphate galactose phosphotransferase WbaP
MTPSAITLERRHSAPPTTPPAAAAVTPRPPLAEALPPRIAPSGVPRRGTRNGWAMRLVYFLSDLATIGLGLSCGALALALIRSGVPALPTEIEWKLYAILTVGLLFVAATVNTYAAVPPRPVRQFRGWVTGSILVCLALIAAAQLLGIGSALIYLSLGIGTIVSILAASFFRALCRSALGGSRWWGTRLIVVGHGGLAAKAFSELQREPQWGLCPVGFVDDDVYSDEKVDSDHYVGPLDRLDELALEYGVDRALAVAHSFAGDELAELLSRRSSRIRHWIILPPLQRFPSLWLEECEAARLPALVVTNRLALPGLRFTKRVFDLSLTFIVGLSVLPLIALLALLVRLGSPGPIFYGSERLGRHGRRFKAWKFRSMYSNADDVLLGYLDEHPHLAAEWQEKTKLRHDPRITWIGHWLRVTSLDELPQIWNVLVGEMSLVGPRPILPCEIDKYGDHYEHYSKVLPGLTGLWQVSGRNNTTYRERLDLDTYYVRNWSPWLDIYILACTVKVVILGEGAY